jgi:anti-sigma-K factor RskA
MRDDEMVDVTDPALDDAVLEALAELHAEPPPPALAARVLAAAAAERSLRDTRGALQRWRLVGAVAASLAVVLAGLLVASQRLAADRKAEIAGAREQQRDLARDNAALAAKLDAQTRQLAALEASVGAQAGVLRVLAAPRPRVATLAPKTDVPMQGRVLVDPATGAAAALLAGLDPALAGRVYELWTIRGSEAPEPAGLLTVAPDGTAWTRVERLSRPDAVTAFAVSIEPAGGSPSPTGPIVLVGPVAAG